MDSDIAMDDSLVDIDNDSETSYASEDTLGKLWAFINQVRVFCMHDNSLGRAGARGRARVRSCMSETRHGYHS